MIIALLLLLFLLLVILLLLTRFLLLRLSASYPWHSPFAPCSNDKLQ